MVVTNSEGESVYFDSFEGGELDGQQYLEAETEWLARTVNLLSASDLPASS